MLIDGADALEWRAPRPKGQKQQRQPYLSYASEFEWREAAAAYPMPYPQFLELPGDPQWIDPENPTDSKCDVLVWYRYHRRLQQLMNGAG